MNFTGKDPAQAFLTRQKLNYSESAQAFVGTSLK
jgi:hypothetical protein